MDNASNTPDINLTSVFISLKYLRCHIIQSSNYRLHELIFIASSKIDELQKRGILLGIECHHDILWLKISMSDTLTVHLNHPTCNV